MQNKFYLKIRSNYYVCLLGLLNLAGLSFLLGCSGNTDKSKNNKTDSLARVKKINDSLAIVKQKQDSIMEVKRISDSLKHADSVKKVKKPKLNYKPNKPAVKYGVVPVKY